MASHNTILMNRAHIQRCIKRLSLQVWEHHEKGKEIIIIGLNKRGSAVAQQISSELEKFSGEKVNFNVYDVENANFLPDNPDFSNRHVAVVDDVVFSGQTMFKALTAIYDKAEPAQTHVVVLIDRGHRKVPVQADFTGLKIPTKPGEHVDVVVKNEKILEVTLKKTH